MVGWGMMRMMIPVVEWRNKEVMLALAHHHRHIYQIEVAIDRRGRECHTWCVNVDATILIAASMVRLSM